MQECSQVQAQLRETRAELSRVAEFESMYTQEREEKLVMESVSMHSWSMYVCWCAVGSRICTC